MVKKQSFTNKKTDEELSLSIIDNGYKVDDSGTVDCVVNENGLSPKQQRKGQNNFVN